MTARYVSQDLEWTSSMKECVRKKVILPLERYLNGGNFELSVHLSEVRKRMDARKPQFEIWLILQTFDGRNNQIVRRMGDDFHTLVKESGESLKGIICKDRTRQRPFYRPLAFANR